MRYDVVERAHGNDTLLVENVYVYQSTSESHDTDACKDIFVEQLDCLISRRKLFDRKLFDVRATSPAARPMLHLPAPASHVVFPSLYSKTTRPIES